MVDLGEAVMKWICIVSYLLAFCCAVASSISFVSAAAIDGNTFWIAVLGIVFLLWVAVLLAVGTVAGDTAEGGSK